MKWFMMNYLYKHTFFLKCFSKGLMLKNVKKAYGQPYDMKELNAEGRWEDIWVS